MDSLRVINILLIVFISAEYALSSKQGAAMMDKHAETRGETVKRQPEPPNHQVGTPGKEKRVQQRASMMMDKHAETRGETVKRKDKPIQEKRAAKGSGNQYRDLSVEEHEDGEKKDEHQKEEHQKEEQQKEEKQKEGQQQQMGVDPKKKYGNPTRRIFYDADGICTCGEEADNVYVVKPGVNFVVANEVLKCANSSRITFGDYVYLSNYGLPQNLAQKKYMICMIRTFGSDFFNPDLTSKTGTGIKLKVGSFVAKYTRYDKFKPYLYPGPKEIYEGKKIDVGKFREGVVAFIIALLQQHKLGKDDYETLDNLIGPIERNDNNLKKQYEDIVKTAISIRKAKFEYEQAHGVSYYIK